MFSRDENNFLFPRLSNSFSSYPLSSNLYSQNPCSAIIEKIIENKENFLHDSMGYSSMKRIGLIDKNVIDSYGENLYSNILRRLFSSNFNKIKSFSIDVSDEEIILNFLIFLFHENRNIKKMDISLNFDEKKCSIRTFGHIFFYIKNDFNINHLSLSSQDINDDYIESLYKFLSNSNEKIVEEYKIIMKDISNDIGFNIKNLEKISHLFYSLYEIIGERKYENHIKILDISCNKHITNKSLPFLEKMVNDLGVKNINVSNTSIQSDEKGNLKFLFDNFFDYEHRDILDYTGLKLCDNDIEHISKYINSTYFDDIYTIYFMGNNITSKGIDIFFNQLILNKNNYLMRINLSENNLDDECMETLGLLIESKNSIKYLFLKKNKLTDKGIETLSHYITGDTSLSILDISGNDGITDNSYECLTNIVKHSNIENLDLNQTKCSKENINSIKKLSIIPIENREIPLKTIKNVKSASKRLAYD